MKKYIIFSLMIICLVSCQSKKDNYDGYIEFIHVGECDKPITTILIIKEESLSLGKKDITEDEVIMVNEKIFNNLFNYLTDKHKEGRCIEKTSHKYGSFKVVITKNTKVRKVEFCYFIEGRKQSFVIFKELLEYLKQHDTEKNLQQTIETYIIHRIKNPPPVGSGLE